MMDLPKLLQLLGTLADRRSRVLLAEAELWAETNQVLTKAASTGQEIFQKAEPPSAIKDGIDRLVTTHQAADILHLSTSTLAKWRVYGGGPAFSKLGRRVFYRQTVLDSFIAAKTYPHTSAYK